MDAYKRTYDRWKANPEAFWAKAAQDIDWIRPWRKTFERVDGLDRWFVGAECNTCYNCLDRHVGEGGGGQKALIYDSPVTGSRRATPMPSCSTRSRRFGAALVAWACARATGSSSTCRWCRRR